MKPNTAVLSPRKKRLMLGLAVLVLGAAVTFLVLNAFNSSVAFYISPSEVAGGKAPKDRVFRMGGLVAAQSVKRAPGSLEVAFSVTDGRTTIPAIYVGALPDLFKECKGVVTQGKLLASGQFVASEVLAKHDENYQAPAVQDALAKTAAAQSAGASPKKGVAAMAAIAGC